MIAICWLLAKAVFVPNEKGELVAQTNPPTEIPTESVPPVEMPPGEYGMMFVKMFLTLIALVALLGGSVWFLRRLIQQRMQRKGSGQRIHILEKRMISPKTMLYLVEVDSEKVLLAESHLEVRRIHNLHPTSTTPPNE
jgi:flagellar biogenesis protein FliO